jgi:hypothetical protein
LPGIITGITFGEFVESLVVVKNEFKDISVHLFKGKGDFG